MNHIPVNTTLLERLALVQPDQWARIERRARRVARDLPLVESVWIDAMLQLGYVTPYQAKQLQEGNAESLQVGSYVILHRRESLGWADCFDAYRIDDRRTVHLAVIQGVPQEAWEPLSEQLIQLREKGVREKGVRNLLPERHEGCCAQKVPDTFFSDLFLSINEVGIDDQRGVWVTSAPCQGESVAHWMVQHGRLPPTVVLEIARQMAQGLSQLEAQQKNHGDLRAATLFLCPTQEIKLLLPGVREVARPRESFAETAGPIDMYDGLSPERATDGTLPDVKSDLFAAGSLWWQMLVGRSPMPGGDGMAKLRAAARREIEDVRKHAADVPEPLAKAITACTARNRENRPDSFQEVAAMLGQPDSRGTRALRRTLRGNRTAALPIVSATGVSRQARYVGRAIVAAGILVAVAALGLAADRFFNPPSQQVVVLPKPVPKVEVKPEVPPQKLSQASVDQTLAGSPATDNVEPPVAGDGANAGNGANEIHDADTSHARRLTENDNGAETIILDSNEPIPAETLAARLTPGVKVTSRPNKRAKVLIVNNSFQIKVSGVHFENLDFVAAKPAATKASETRQAMLELRESDATFHGCTFHAPQEKDLLPRTVLHWVFPAPSDSADPATLQTELHNAQIVFENCVFGRETGTTLHAEVHAAVAVELRNVLHTGGGPMLFLENPPQPEEPWRVLADHITLRESGPFWACRYQSTLSGPVRIEANNSVFAPKGTQPLLLFVGENDPEPIFRKIEWTGRGTLEKKTTPTAAWQDNAGNRETLSDQRASIDGLIRSQVEFAGAADNSPASSVLQTWDAPVTSDTPPGVDAKRLP